MLNRLIPYLFYLLFFLTPLVWYPHSYELFEFNKMIVVYLLTTLITSLWLLRMIKEKKILLCKTPLDIPILLFLLSQIISTIFSIDPHTSWFGYYSRSNGGLLSAISYILLYYALVSNLNKEQIIQALKAALFGGAVIALWAIPEHFGVSLSCVLLRGDFTDSCWVQDVQARVFATLGQPNWLAAYLEMLIFPAIYFYLSAKNRLSKVTWALLITFFYLAFTFTYSRGAMLGFLAGLLIFVIPLILSSPRRQGSKFAGTTKNITILLAVFLVINLIYGSALTRFQLSQLLPQQPSNPQPAASQQPSAGLSQLENGGTESGEIRLIVWKGALEIFKHYPLFGSGVETFAYSYYNFRPVAHNMVSEWDFLYNKAHNEYLNYLATTGLFGFIAYMAIIFFFITWCIRYYLSDNTHFTLLVPALLAAYLSYLIQNFFGFSVVVIAMFFFLFPGIAFVFTDSLKSFNNPKLSAIRHTFSALFYRHKIFRLIAITFIVFLTLYYTVSVVKLWVTDLYFSTGSRYSDAGNAGRAYNALSEAAGINPKEPFYKSELGFAAAASAVALKDSDATLSARLKDEAIADTQDALKISPKNVSFWRSAIRTYYQLASLDKSFYQKTVETVEQTIALAPTDPKLYYNKAVILGQMDQNNEAIAALNKAVELKPNYREAYIALAQFYFDQKDYQKAVDNMNKVLLLVPNDPEAEKVLNNWGQKGIATTSAETKK